MFGAVAEKPAACAAERGEIAGLERDGFDRLRQRERDELLAQQCAQALGVARG